MPISTPTGVTPPRGKISGYKIRNVPNYTPEQMQLFAKLLGSAQGGLEGGGLDFLSQLAGGDESAFQQAEQPFYSAFQKGLGEIGSRFAGLGAVGSSAFQNATSGAAKELGEDVGAQRLGLQQSAIERLLELSENLLGKKPYQTYLEQKRPTFGSYLGKLGSSLIGKTPNLLLKHFLGG